MKTTTLRFRVQGLGFRVSGSGNQVMHRGGGLAGITTTMLRHDIGEGLVFRFRLVARGIETTMLRHRHDPRFRV